MSAFRKRPLQGGWFTAVTDRHWPVTARHGHCGFAHRLARTVIDAYLERSGVQITPTQRADNPAMVMSLVASLHGVSLIPAYVQALMPWSVVSRPLAGEVPTIDLVVGYSKTNESPVLKVFLSRLQELIGLASDAGARITGVS